MPPKITVTPKGDNIFDVDVEIPGPQAAQCNGEIYVTVVKSNLHPYDGFTLKRKSIQRETEHKFADLVISDKGVYKFCVEVHVTDIIRPHYSEEVTVS